MKRTLTYALSAVLGGAILTPALAQENFPDAQENHWAFEALLNMKKAGLLVGYPDGLFRGGRPASRYELAVAIHATYQHLKNLSDGMGSKIAALEDRINKLPSGGGSIDGLATKAELQQLRDALAATNATVNGMKSWGDDISNLKRMATAFERELASMGVDVESMKKGLADLANRVTALEKRKLPVDIHGTINFIAQGGISEDDHFGITRDGRPLGVSKDDGGPGGLSKDLNVWHQAGFTLTTTNDEGPKGEATLVIGNTLAQSGSLSGDFGRTSWLPSSQLSGVAFGDEVETDIWFHTLQMTFATTIWGQDAKLRAGRVGYHAGPYTFMKPESSFDVKLPYFDGPDWIFDGFVAGLSFGNAALDVFAGRQGNRLSSDGTDPWAMWAGNFGHPFEPGGDTGNNPSRPRGVGSNQNGIMIDQHLGFNLNVPLGGTGKLNLNYLFLDSNNTSTLSGSPLVTANRVTVFGGAVKFPVGAFNLEAGYSATNLNDDSDTQVDEDNAAMWFKGSYTRGERWGVDFGFRQIDPQFYAPGYWGRVGIWTNPTDVESAHIGGWFTLSNRTKLSFHKEFFRGRDVDLGGGQGLSSDDEVRSFKLMISHKINDSWSMMLGGEWVEWDLADRFDGDTIVFDGGSPRERWYDLGFKYAFNENSFFSFLWQISDYDAKGVFGFNPFSSLSDDQAKGHRKVIQLSVRY